MTEQYGRIHKDYKKGQETGLKEEKPMAKQRPTPEKEQALKNEKPENGSCHKKPRMGRQNVQTGLQTTMNAWAAGRFWMYIEVKHVQGPDITGLYPTNTGGVEVMGQR